MRPEIKEYNYDWLMGKTLAAAAKVPAGTQKETDLTLRYIPTYKPAADTFFKAGEVGTKLFHLLARYYENVLSARARAWAAETFTEAAALAAYRKVFGF